MTQDEMIPILKEWRDTIRKAEADIQTHFSPLIPTPESPLYNIPWNLMDAYTNAVSALIGDRDEWLSWYWAENEMGTKRMEAMIGGKYRKIGSIKQLARAIADTRGE